MERFGFGPAGIGEDVVYGAQRPGYPSKSVDEGAILEWIGFVRRRGIHRICCLLPASQLAFYRFDLLAEYQATFGDANVLPTPIEDFHLCEADILEGQVLRFLADSATRKLPVVVHCSGGSGRTGHVLAAWLVRHRGLDVDTALAQVRSTGRNPREAVDCGNATLDQLRALLTGATPGNPI